MISEIPNKIKKLKPELAYIYGFLDGQLENKEVIIEDFAPETEWVRNNGETVLIKQMNQYHLIASYKKLVRQEIHQTNLGKSLLNEINERGLEDRLIE